MKHMDKLRDMLCEELDEITKKGKLTVDSLDAVDMITHSIKSIDTIIAMEESGYSNYYPGRKYYYDDGYSRRGTYARDRNRNRDNMDNYNRNNDDYMER